MTSRGPFQPKTFYDSMILSFKVIEILRGWLCPPDYLTRLTAARGELLRFLAST